MGTNVFRLLPTKMVFGHTRCVHAFGLLRLCTCCTLVNCLATHLQRWFAHALCGMLAALLLLKDPLWFVWWVRVTLWSRLYVMLCCWDAWHTLVVCYCSVSHFLTKITCSLFSFEHLRILLRRVMTCSCSVLKCSHLSTIVRLLAKRQTKQHVLLRCATECVTVFNRVSLASVLVGTNTLKRIHTLNKETIMHAQRHWLLDRVNHFFFLFFFSTQNCLQFSFVLVLVESYFA